MDHETISKFFSNTKNIPTWIGNTLFDNTYDLLVAKSHIGDLNDKSNEKYFSKTTPSEQYGYETAPKKLNLFSEMDSDFTEKKYRNILLKELKASKNAIVLDYQTTYPDVKLGQIIEVQEKEYLVTDVECKTQEKRLVVNKQQEVVTLDATPTLLFKVKPLARSQTGQTRMARKSLIRSAQPSYLPDISGLQVLSWQRLPMPMTRITRTA